MSANQPSPTVSDEPLSRRRALSLLGLGGLGLVATACSSSSSSSTAAADTTAVNSAATTTDAATTSSAATTPAAASTSTAAATTIAADLTTTPTETGGPFPADGSNENGNGTVVNVLKDSRSVRSDVRSDLDGSNVQEGVPFTLKVQVLEQASGGPLAGAAFYIWHCNRDGQYSEYNSPMLGGDFTARSYLRGTQITDASGNATFSTILPGRYPGRAFHIHFEVYSDTTYATKLLTSQMAMDDTLVDTLYAAADGYSAALKNETTNGGDQIFSDGVSHQLLTVTGDVASGLTATFTAVV